MNKTIKLITLLGGLFAITLLSFISNTNAYAADPTVTCGPTTCQVGSEIDKETGGSKPGGGGGGTTTNPGLYERVWVKIDYWLQKNCGTGNNLYPAHKKYEFPVGVGKYSCWGGHFFTETFWCPPDHRNVPALGMVEVRHRITGKVVSVYCTYPVDPYPTTSTFTRVTGAESIFYHTETNASKAKKYGNGGVVSDKTGYISANFTWSKPEKTTSVNKNWNAETRIKNGAPAYGYYRLDWKTDYIEISKTAWPAWTGNKNVEYKELRRFSQTSTSAYTYACNLKPIPLRSGIVSGAMFDPAACATNDDPEIFTCEWVNGGSVGTVGSNFYSNNRNDTLYVMRDGNRIPVSLPSLKINSSSNLRNTNNLQIMVGVDTRRVSPSNPDHYDDANHARQWFDASFRWNTWLANPSPNNKHDIAFYWSSDYHDKGFSWTSTARFEGEVRLPSQAGTGSSATTSWVKVKFECGDNGERFISNANWLYGQAPTISVMRATNN